MLWHFMQIVSLGFAWNVKVHFLGKIRKIFQNVVCWKFSPAYSALIFSHLISCSIHSIHYRVPTIVCGDTEPKWKVQGTWPILTFTILWAFSADDKLMILFLFFPENRIWHFMQIVRRQFAWNVKSCFLGKIRKIFQNVCCWKFYPEC